MTECDFILSAYRIDNFLPATMPKDSQRFSSLYGCHNVMPSNEMREVLQIQRL